MNFCEQINNTKILMKMNVTILTPIFPPEQVISAKTSYQIATEMQKRGHQVLVLTAFPSRPSGNLFPGYSRTLYNNKIQSTGYKLVRCFSYFSKHSSIISRTLENLSFGFTSGLFFLFSPPTDVIYVNTWPIFAQGIISLVAHLKRVPIVLSVQDLYPESLSSQGRIQMGGLVYRFIIAIDRYIARGCKSIILISDRFARSYMDLRGIPPEKINVIPNWIESRLVQQIPKEKYRLKCSIPKNVFVLVYGGNIGRAAGVENIIEALESVKSDREIVMIVAGSGTNLEACRVLAKNLSKRRVIFHSPWFEEETSEVLGAADILVLPTSGDQSLASVPSKMITYMLAARPILAVVHGASDTADLIGKTGCGWVVPPDSPEQLARKIEEVSKISNVRLAKMGQSGREYALQNFSSEICLPKVIDIILTVAKP